jgi:pre-rRNA-processing protein IPI1
VVSLLLPFLVDKSSTAYDISSVPFHGFATVIGVFFNQAKVLRNKDLMETYLGPLITCIPGLISNAADDSKGYLLEV